MIEAIAAGATGYLQKVSGMERLLATVRDVAAGELRVPADTVRRVFTALWRESGREETGMGKLTERELEILAAFSRGMSYAEIGGARGVKPVTIRNAVLGIQHKLGVGSKQEMVTWAVRNGLLDD